MISPAAIPASARCTIPAFGTTFSAVVAGMKTFFPDLPLNSGFYRPIEVIAPEDTRGERALADRASPGS